MKHIVILISIFTFMLSFSRCTQEKHYPVAIFATSESGQKLEQIALATPSNIDMKVDVFLDEVHQEITGFGGSFTEASATLLNRMSPKKRYLVLQAYFSDSGARYSLTRTHINSCDFSLTNYSYAPYAGDLELDSFSINHDKDDIIPMIKDAMALSSEGFKIIASPWTAPPWMKDNNDWKGGKLLPKYHKTWALFFSKYLKAYANEGIKVWGITVENEPLGNDNNWESMHFTAQEMTDFVRNHLGPTLNAEGHEVKVLGYDQNRNDELLHWVDVMYATEASSKHFNGTALHWYASTYDHFPKALHYAHSKAPHKHLIQTEACIDAEVPRWKEDKWYWKKEATDWGYDWAPEQDKYLHPKYAPVNRYAQDIIGCLNNHVDGWIDWNMVLDKQGGPNWAKNWCIAPVIVDPETDEVYFTPLYYVMAHFSKFIRPGAIRIGHTSDNDELNITVIRNPDNSIVCVLFNPLLEAKGVEINIGEETFVHQIDKQSLHTIILKHNA